MKKTFQFPSIGEKDEDGFYVVGCPVLSGCYSQGKTLDEALKNIREVIDLCKGYWMQIKYTRHAKQRMKWRRITPTEIKSILENPDKIIKSKNDKKIRNIKTIKKRLIELLYVVENNQLIIITVIDKSD